MFCQEQAVQLHRAKPELDAAGARLVVIGNGLPSFIEGFRDKSGFDGDVYTDPERLAYKALRLRRSLLSTVDPRAAVRAVKVLLDGNRQGRTKGDPFQQGGVFVIDTSGEILYRYASEFSGDHPPLRDITRALARVNA